MIYPRTMMELVDFLAARLDEDEQAARAASGPRSIWPRWDLSEWYGLEEPSSLIGRGSPNHPLGGGHFTPVALDTAIAVHIARQDPARELREVAAKRSHIERWREVDTWIAEDDRPTIIRNELLSVRRAYMLVLADDAQAYADHPDYREEWRP